MTPKRLRSYRLSDQCSALLEALARHLGVTQTAVVELAVRALAKRHGVKREEGKDEHSPIP